MAKHKEGPPRWQKGQREAEFVVPARRTGGRKDETVKIAVRWDFPFAKHITDPGWGQWQAQCARERLDPVVSASLTPNTFTDTHANDLSDAVTHAVNAWCRERLGPIGADDPERYKALVAKAPASLKRRVVAADRALSDLKLGVILPDEAIDAAREAVASLLRAVAHLRRTEGEK